MSAQDTHPSNFVASSTAHLHLFANTVPTWTLPPQTHQHSDELSEDSRLVRHAQAEDTLDCSKEGCLDQGQGNEHPVHTQT